jgi:rubrerythrin
MIQWFDSLTLSLYAIDVAKDSDQKEVFKMAEEGKTYVCEMCGAEVKVIKKPVPDPKCPTLTCCGKEMKEKEGEA